jgi:hypothetical protein
LRRWFDAGVNRILYVMRPEPPQAALQRLERLAALL